MILRLIFSALALLAFASAQAPVIPAARVAPPPPAVPTIGIIDFYGLNKIPEDRVRKTLGFQEGDAFPRSKAEVEEHLDTLSGVVESHLEAVCCEAGKLVLYVGLEERGAPHFDLREAPEREVALPLQIVTAYRGLRDALEAAARRGATAEDLTHGHSLLADPLAREIQLQFPQMAKDHLPELRDVLRNSDDDELRAMAAYVIAYAARKSDIAGDLQFALRDADPGVRANATRGLMALAVYARLTPDSGLKLEPTWFIEMLHSLSWSDRDHALRVLQILTDGRDPLVLGQLRDRALPSLVEMTRWKTLAHALPAFVLTGRVAGWTEQQIQDAWTRGDRESVIAAARAGAAKKPR